MSESGRSRAARPACIAASALALCGCSSLSGWFWGEPLPAAPERVYELVVQSTDGIAIRAFDQYWQRNTLVLDLSNAARSGGISLRRRPGASWPVRVGFKVMPGRFGELEVRGEERLVLPIAAQGTAPVVLELTAGVYREGTEAITVRWGDTQR